MKKQTPKNLIDIYLSGRATAEEKGILESWYLQRADQQVDGLPEPDYMELEKEMWPVIDQQAQVSGRLSKLWPAKGGQSKSGNLWPILGSAAAVVVIALGIWLYYSSFFKSGQPIETGIRISSIRGIMPAKNTATLTLTNGQVIALNDIKAGVVIDARKFIYADGSPVLLASGNVTAIAKDRIAKNINISTPRGGTYQVLLPDGSRVWLNAASSIKFPLSFDGAKQRVVELNGEAYFEVKKSPDIPFIVKSRGQEAMVLGTTFNINSYADEEHIVTTLVTGSLKVSTETGKSILLSPGRETLLGPKGLEGHAANVNMAISWRQGTFYFNKTSFDVMMRQVSRWYNVDVVYLTKKIPDIRFTGEIKRDVMLQTVLTYIEDLGVKLRISDRTLYIE